MKLDIKCKMKVISSDIASDLQHERPRNKIRKERVSQDVPAPSVGCRDGRAEE